LPNLEVGHWRFDIEVSYFKKNYSSSFPSNLALSFYVKIIKSFVIIYIYTTSIAHYFFQECHEQCDSTFKQFNLKSFVDKNDCISLKESSKLNKCHAVFFKHHSDEITFCDEFLNTAGNAMYFFLNLSMANYNISNMCAIMKTPNLRLLFSLY